MTELLNAVKRDLGKRLYVFKEGKLWNHDRNEEEQNEFFKQAMAIRAAMRQLSKLICNCRDENLWEAEGCRNFEDWLGKHNLSYEDVEWRPKEPLEARLMAMLDEQRQRMIDLHISIRQAFAEFPKEVSADIKKLPFTGHDFFTANNWDEFIQQERLSPLLDSECMEAMVVRQEGGGAL